MSKTIIQCKFLDENNNPKGRDYAYYSEIPVKVGDLVDVPSIPRSDAETPGKKKVVVTAINLPDETVEAFRDKVKTIIGFHTEED